MPDQTAVDTFIPLVDLKAQFALLRSDLQAAINGVMTRGDFILGEDVLLLEQEFAAFCGVSQAVGCASGTDALQLALRGLGIGVGDEVILPAMTFFATAMAVSLVGATPVLVDVDPDRALLVPDLVAQAITARTRAIIPVHLYGQCADMTALSALARQHNLYVIEDACQAHGAAWKGRPAGSWGDVGCFSFYPGKNLGAYGDGGMITTQSAPLADRIRMLRHCGSNRKYHHPEVGLNSRLDTLQAAILRVKLNHLPAWNRRRQELASQYHRALQPLAGVTLTAYHPDAVYHLYVIRVANRDRILQQLNQAGIGAGIHYPFAIHQLEAYQGQGLSLPAAGLPVAEDWAARGLSLPIYPEMPEAAIPRIAELLRAIIH